MYTQRQSALGEFKQQQQDGDDYAVGWYLHIYRDLSFDTR